MIKYIPVLIILFSTLFISCKKKSSAISIEGDGVGDYIGVNVPQNYLGKWKLLRLTSVPQVAGLKRTVFEGKDLESSQTILLQSNGTFVKEIIKAESIERGAGTYSIEKNNQNVTNIVLKYDDNTSWQIMQSCGVTEELEFNKDGIMFSRSWPNCDGPYIFDYIKD